MESQIAEYKLSQTANVQLKTCFAHYIAPSHLPSENDINVLKYTVNQMNTILNKHTNEVEDMRSKLVALEIENNNLKDKLESFQSNMKFYIEKAVNDTATTVIENLKTQQTFMESRTYELLNTLQQEMTTLKTSLTSPNPSSVDHVPDSRLDDAAVPAQYCNFCRKSFQTKKSYLNHMKSTHKNQSNNSIMNSEASTPTR